MIFGNIFQQLTGAGRWNFPGGLVEEGETLLQAAIRETQEKQGIAKKNAIKITDAQLFDIDNLPSNIT